MNLLGQKDVQALEAMRFERVIREGLITDWSFALDLGAHIGSWTVLMAKYFSSVIAIEPAPDNVDILKYNSEDYDNIRIIQAAVGRYSGRCEVFKPLSGSGKVRKTSTAYQTKYKKDGDTEMVSVDSLELPSLGFMKIDTEGFELEVLEGAKNTIKLQQPIICMEIGGAPNKQLSSSEEPHRRLLSWGYEEVFREGVDRVYRKVK